MIDIDPSKQRQLSPSYGDKSFTGLSDTGEALAITYRKLSPMTLADEFVSYKQALFTYECQRPEIQTPLTQFYTDEDLFT